MLGEQITQGLVCCAKPRKDCEHCPYIKYKTAAISFKKCTDYLVEDAAKFMSKNHPHTMVNDYDYDNEEELIHE
jgi:hypothetical protein